MCSIIALCALGCPSEQTALSGTYREVPGETPTDELLAVEFFRFGNYSNAIVRTFRVLEVEDTVRESGCEWTALGEAPGADGSFTLTIPKTLQRGELTLTGSVDGEQMELTMREDGGVARTTMLRLSSSEANNACDVVNSFLIEPSFELTGRTNELPEDAGWTLTQPTFAMLWVGVEARVEQNVIIWGAINDHTAEIVLGNQNREGERGLRESLAFSIPPPDEKVRVASGSTSYALGHFVVIDDVNTSEGFRWDVSAEPIVASSLQLGAEPDSPFPQATGLGKAMLYVEGKLSELHPNLRENIVNIDAYQNTRDDARFYIVDVFFADGDVLGMRLPQNPSFLTNRLYRKVTMEVTDRYLRTSEILLPRLLPIDEF